MKKNLGLGKIESWDRDSKREAQRHQARERIQEAFRHRSSVVVIPAKEDLAGVPAGRKIRTAAYCRVSTDEEKQTGSYEIQVNYYQRKINQNPDWELVGIYADEGRSGTSIAKRVEFRRMLDDCRAGKIDQVITKCGTRFSRNIVDAVNLVRELSALNPPVNVIFETDGYESKNQQSENHLISIMTGAQNESERKSQLVKWTRGVLFEQGVPLIPTHCLLGYGKNDQGELVIVKKEAKVIRFIFNSYLESHTPTEIAQMLTEGGIPTVKGNRTWTSAAILSILRNEKYVGDVLMQKTYTENVFSHKQCKNTGRHPQYYVRDHHKAIISREIWDLVQEQLPQRLYKRRHKPSTTKVSIQKVRRGPFQGCIILDPHWSRKEYDCFLRYLIEEINKPQEAGYDYSI